MEDCSNFEIYNYICSVPLVKKCIEMNIRLVKTKNNAWLIQNEHVLCRVGSGTFQIYRGSGTFGFQKKYHGTVVR